MKKQTLLKLASTLLALASVPFLWVYGAYRWAVWRVDHPAPGEVSSISVITGEKEHSGVAIIGGADGPTAIFVTVRMKMEVYLLLGAALLAGAAGLWYLVKKRGKKQGKQNPLGR